MNERQSTFSDLVIQYSLAASEINDAVISSLGTELCTYRYLDKNCWLSFIYLLFFYIVLGK